MSKKIKVTQIASTIRRQEWQTQCLKGLGLGKMNRSKVLIDTPEIRGMVNKIKHLVTVTEA
jgi:large subunit ribosomal protein L30